MNKASIFVLGGTSTITLSIFLFVLAPRIQVENINRAHASAQDPYTPEQLRGREIYIENGCIYCHSQQVRDPVAGADRHFGWGRPSRASDYVHDKPHLLGTMRTGPDLSNIGSRKPSREWHHLHFYNPRLLVSWSLMPDFSFLYETVLSESKPAANALKLPQPENTWIVPSPQAEDLTDYMLSLKRDREPAAQENAP